MLPSLKNFWRDAMDEGPLAGAVYLIVLAGMGIVAVTALFLLGQWVRGLFL